MHGRPSYQIEDRKHLFHGIRVKEPVALQSSRPGFIMKPIRFNHLSSTTVRGHLVLSGLPSTELSIPPRHLMMLINIISQTLSLAEREEAVEFLRNPWSEGNIQQHKKKGNEA